MSKVVFLSNVDRRFAMMKVALQQLQQENLLSNDSVCVKLSDNTVWNDEWQKLLEDADILLLKWMGAGLDTHFFKKLLPFIKKHQLRYYIDAAGTEEEELVSGIEKNDLEKLKAYALYSGMKNYRNLFLYANGIFTGKTDIELPDPMYLVFLRSTRSRIDEIKNNLIRKLKLFIQIWQHIKKIFAMLQNRLLVFYFIVTNGYGMTLSIKRH